MTAQARLEPRPRLARASLAPQGGQLAPEVRTRVGVTLRAPAGAPCTASATRTLEPERIVREVGAEPVQPDACEVLLGVVRVGESEVEVVGVGEALLVRIARRVDRVEAVEAAPDRGEAPALVPRFDLRHGHSVLVQVAGARGEVERRLVEQQPCAELGQLREIVEIDPVAGVVLRVVLGAVVLRGEGGDVDPGDPGREEGPDLGPRLRLVELPAEGKQSVPLGLPAAMPRPARQLRRDVEREEVA